MRDQQTDICKNCVNYHADTEHMGQCRAYAPTPVADPQRQSVWAAVSWNDWCSEFDDKHRQNPLDRPFNDMYHTKLSNVPGKLLTSKDDLTRWLSFLCIMLLGALVAIIIMHLTGWRPAVLRF